MYYWAACWIWGNDWVDWVLIGRLLGWVCSFQSFPATRYGMPHPSPVLFPVPLTSRVRFLSVATEGSLRNNPKGWGTCNHTHLEDTAPCKICRQYTCLILGQVRDRPYLKGKRSDRATGLGFGRVSRPMPTVPYPKPIQPQ